ncbi:hypothetical protein Lal_00001615 [Lupinus albus]|uniref:Uncharacterized protein n=1 Tax=Lupinus albus TaxID=3870 RepID=A0A6A5P6R6_LUPAL|nr:hypothetical protein Lalb_Chr11g0067851 [Lupinus albus]KAF1893177.1 hypothetical protein Lal_00001615 [Lupinus albus]
MTNYNHQHALLLVLLFLLLILSSSYARLLNGDNSHATTKTTLNIAFPNNGVFLKQKKKPYGHVSPLILNMLPKGKVPPSGPSKRINNFNN